MSESTWTDDSLALLQARLAATAPKHCDCTCGGLATNPLREPRWTKRCYRRWIKAGKPATLHPADPVASANGLKGAETRARQIAEGPAVPQRDEAAVARSALEWRQYDARRRVAAEAGRAAAYLAVRGGRDVLAPARIRERVRDREAFDILVGCHGSRTVAVKLLADLMPAIDESEVA